MTRRLAALWASLRRTPMPRDDLDALIDAYRQAEFDAASCPAPRNLARAALLSERVMAGLRALRCPICGQHGCVSPVGNCAEPSTGERRGELCEGRR